MTIVESIKCVLQQNNDGLTSKQIAICVPGKVTLTQFGPS